MTSVIDSGLVQFAVDLAGRAGRMSAEFFFDSAGERAYKVDGSEVTKADVAVEDFVRAELARFAPDDGILGEEHGETAGRSGNRWVVDPISGTSYFTRRMPLFANLFAYEDAHGPALGIINMPVQREMVFASRGGGCFLLRGDDPTPRPIRLGDRSKPDGVLVLGANQHAWSEELLLALHRRTAMVGAIHHPVMHLVNGRADAVVMTHQGYDDMAPLPIILREAGGTVTDLRGEPVLGGDGSVLAAGNVVHSELLGLVSGIPHTRGPKSI